MNKQGCTSQWEGCTFCIRQEGLSSSFGSSLWLRRRPFSRQGPRCLRGEGELSLEIRFQVVLWSLEVRLPRGQHADLEPTRLTGA